jgi:hypothetical protein
VMNLRVSRAIIASGTLLQNNLAEIARYTQILDTPGLSTAALCRQYLIRPVEDSPPGPTRLRRFAAIYALRRTKSQIDGQTGAADHIVSLERSISIKMSDQLRTAYRSLDACQAEMTGGEKLEEAAMTHQLREWSSLRR